MSLPEFVAPDSLATLALHAGRTPDPATGALLVPPHLTTTYAQSAVGEHRGYTYSRSDNPTVAALESRLAALEGAAHCTAYASGLAATAALLHGVLKPGDRVVCGRAVYGGTVRLLRELFAPLGILVVFVDAADPAALTAALARPARLVLVETPANPTLALTDLALAANLAKCAGALLAVDNTLLSPILQRPLEFGADIVLHSTTKWIEGGGATIGGALCVNDAGLNERLRWVRNATGSIQHPFTAWLTLQGLKTLPARLARHGENAERVALFLDKHPAVARVNFPGLPRHPQAALARAQQRGGGALLSFEVHGGVETGLRVINTLELFTRAENLGSAESLVTHPVTMTHAAVPAEQRAAAGITDGLIRLSVGLEDAADLIADLAQALATAALRRAV